MYIISGSTNPVKQAAVVSVLDGIFPEARFEAVPVPSGVPDQPWGEEETRTGAFNRAQAVLTRTDAALGVGLEGGVVETSFGLMTCAWCVLLNREGILGIGGGANLLLPDRVAQMVRAGVELGTAMDTLVGKDNTKYHDGAIGILTQGLLDRQRAYEVIVKLAAAPFRRPDYYDRGYPK